MSRADAVTVGYAQGVPMGSDLLVAARRRADVLRRRDARPEQWRSTGSVKVWASENGALTRFTTSRVRIIERRTRRPIAVPTAAQLSI
jgi:hypothetical protein